VVPTELDPRAVAHAAAGFELLGRSKTSHK
jgi:hypothetical protein